MSADEIPRRLRFARARFGLASRRVLDVGCGPGVYLRHFGPGSVGLDLNPEPARARGLDARPWNFQEGIPDDLHHEFDAVWCSNLLEHVLAPHSFLIDLRPALRPSGTLVVAVPQTTPVRAGPWRGYLAADHVNFFTPRTVAHTIERAGYQIDYVGNPSAPSWLPRSLSKPLRVGPTVLVAASPIVDFEYPEKAHKQLVNGVIQFKH